MGSCSTKGRDSDNPYYFMPLVYERHEKHILILGFSFKIPIGSGKYPPHLWSNHAADPRQ